MGLNELDKAEIVLRKGTSLITMPITFVNNYLLNHALHSYGSLIHNANQKGVKLAPTDPALRIELDQVIKKLADLDEKSQRELKANFQKNSKV